MEKKQRQFSLMYFVAAFFLVLAVHDFLIARHTETLSYSEFKVLLNAGKVEDLTLGTRIISGRLKREGLEGLLPKAKVEEIQLETLKVRFAGEVESTWFITLLSWVLPALIFVGVWMWLTKRFGPASGLMAIGKSKAKVYMEKETGVTFADVAGIDEARAELMEIVEFLKTPQRYRRLGGKIPKGVLIVGAPGTGKTLLAKAVAGEAGVPFFSLSGSDFVEMFVGVGAARVRDLFAQAQEKAPCIIFIDELDALGKARGLNPIGGHDEREQTLNQLLVEMDGFDTNKGVIIMAATNRPEILDPALLRPGRFDRQVALDRPDIKGREKILQVHVKPVTLSPEVDLSAIAAKTPGFVGADLANLVNEAALLAALGYTQQLPTEDRYLLKRAEILDRLDVLLGGRVAEEIVFGDVSTGAQDDLQRATDMARLMVTQYGMSEHLGLATFEEPRTSVFLNISKPQRVREYSEQTAQTIDEEIRKLLADAHTRVEQTLAARRNELDALAKLLLEKEVIDRETLTQLLRPQQS